MVFHIPAKPSPPLQTELMGLRVFVLARCAPDQPPRPLLGRVCGLARGFRGCVRQDAEPRASMDGFTASPKTPGRTTDPARQALEQGSTEPNSATQRDSPFRSKLCR